MPGSMTADTVKAQVAALQKQFDGAHTPDELSALSKQVAAFQAQLGTEPLQDG